MSGDECSGIDTVAEACWLACVSPTIKPSLPTTTAWIGSLGAWEVACLQLCDSKSFIIIIVLW